MVAAKPYARKVSSEEAREGYIFVLKSRLGFFPPVGKAFELTHAGTTRKAKVEAVPCTCRGPAEPHDHCFVRWSGLKRGDVVTIRQDAGEPPRYRLAVKR